MTNSGLLAYSLGSTPWNLLSCVFVHLPKLVYYMQTPDRLIARYNDDDAKLQCVVCLTESTMFLLLVETAQSFHLTSQTWLNILVYIFPVAKNCFQKLHTCQPTFARLLVSKVAPSWSDKRTLELHRSQGLQMCSQQNPRTPEHKTLHRSLSKQQVYNVFI